MRDRCRHASKDWQTGAGPAHCLLVGTDCPRLFDGLAQVLRRWDVVGLDAEGLRRTTYSI